MYSLYESTATINGKQVQTFGIMGEGIICIHLSECKQTMLHIIQMCNVNVVSPIHVEDVVEDMLFF
ncbi:MAG TPA: hypothetical protein DCY75_06225 [Clostridiales bacterium]|nr:hypothetical protein [Clostridiales bacterium]